jgi:hypothetical protein
MNMSISSIKANVGVLSMFGAVVVTCSLLAATPTSGADPEKEPPKDSKKNADDEFLTKTGNYKLYDGKLVVDITDVKGKIKWQVDFGRGAVSPEALDINKESSWFVFPASPQAVWIFDGNSEIVLLTSTNGPKKTTTAPGAKLPAGWAKILRAEPNPPKKLLDKLPAELQPER